jgi:hypothetical protein
MLSGVIRSGPCVAHPYHQTFKSYHRQFGLTRDGQVSDFFTQVKSKSSNLWLDLTWFKSKMDSTCRSLVYEFQNLVWFRRKFVLWLYLLILISHFPLGFKLETKTEVHKTTICIYIFGLDLWLDLIEKSSQVKVIFWKSQVESSQVVF